MALSLVDELNLASPECLDAILQLLDGDEERHEDFRLFACMNPATDVGKTGLTPNVRSKFTEFFVAEPTREDELMVIVKSYLPELHDKEIKAVLELYPEVRQAFSPRHFFRYV